MKRLLQNQSDLSLASAVFYFAGCLFSVLMLTALHSPVVTNWPFILGLAVCAFVAGCVCLYFGRRLLLTAALVLVCVAGLAVLLGVFVTPIELRAMNSGLLFYTYLIYLVWFGPMWLARAYGYAWLAVYCSVMLVRFSGEVGPYLVTMIVTAVMLGELIGYFKRRLEATSLTDPLCDVWNKRAFEAALERAVAGAARTDRPVSMLFLDLDGLKEVNDEFGHVEGDRVLKLFAREIEAGIRPQDHFARLGGDEFALLLLDTPMEEAFLVGARLRESTTAIGWSFGVAELTPNEEPAAFLARADAQMYDEKLRRRLSR